MEVGWQIIVMVVQPSLVVWMLTDKTLLHYRSPHFQSSPSSDMIDLECHGSLCGSYRLLVTCTSAEGCPRRRPRLLMLFYSHYYPDIYSTVA